jgi:molybdopterin converting factor small subunit
VSNATPEIRGSVRVMSLTQGSEQYALDGEGSVHTVKDAVDKFTNGNGDDLTIRLNNELRTDPATELRDGDAIMLFSSAKVAAEGLPGAE